jgi:cell division protein ZapA
MRSALYYADPGAGCDPWYPAPMAAGRTVQLRVGGQTYRVVSSASEEELQRFAAMVDQKLTEIVPGSHAVGGRVVKPEAILLAAMSLAHDLEEERARSAAVTARARGAFGRMLERVDAALGAPADTPAGSASAGGAPAPRTLEPG